MNKSQIKEFTDNWRNPQPFKQYRISWDIATGSSGDNPAIHIAENFRIARTISLYGLNYDAQYDAIANYSQMFNNAPCIYSRTGHEAVVGQLEKRGVREISLDERGGGKEKYIWNCVKAVQNNDMKVLFDGDKETQTFIYQMEDYTEKKGKYSNDDAEHDDYVSAAYLLCYDYDEIIKTIPYIPIMKGIPKKMY